MVKSEDLVQTLWPSDRQKLRGGKEDAKYGLRAEELGHGCGSETQEEKKVQEGQDGRWPQVLLWLKPLVIHKVHSHLRDVSASAVKELV